MINSREKGCEFEREVAASLSTWWYGVPKALRRTPMSGGMFKTMSSDIVSELEGWPIGVECKHSTAWSWQDLFNPNWGTLGNFWSQCVKECVLEKSPMLVFRGNFGKTYVMYDTNSIGILVPKKLGYKKLCVHDPVGRKCSIIQLAALLSIQVIESLTSDNNYDDWDEDPENVVLYVKNAVSIPKLKEIRSIASVKFPLKGSTDKK
jgi:hypothetical protein